MTHGDRDFDDHGSYHHRDSWQLQRMWWKTHDEISDGKGHYFSAADSDAQPYAVPVERLSEGLRVLRETVIEVHEPCRYTRIYRKEWR